MSGGARTAWQALLLSQAGAVLVLAALLVISVAAHDAPDANIGAGLFVLMLGGLGLPWSIPAFYVESNQATALLAVGAAVLNVMIHGWVFHRSGVQPGTGATSH